MCTSMLCCMLVVVWHSSSPATLAILLNYDLAMTEYQLTVTALNLEPSIYMLYREVPVCYAQSVSQSVQKNAGARSMCILDNVEHIVYIVYISDSSILILIHPAFIKTIAITPYRPSLSSKS